MSPPLIGNARVPLASRVSRVWRRTNGSLSFGTLTGNAYYYPSKGTGLFLKGGLGLGYTEVQIDFLGSETETGFGWRSAPVMTSG